MQLFPLWMRAPAGVPARIRPLLISSSSTHNGTDYCRMGMHRSGFPTLASSPTTTKEMASAGGRLFLFRHWPPREYLPRSSSWWLEHWCQEPLSLLPATPSSLWRLAKFSLSMAGRSQQPPTAVLSSHQRQPIQDLDRAYNTDKYHNYLKYLTNYDNSLQRSIKKILYEKIKYFPNDILQTTHSYPKILTKQTIRNRPRIYCRLANIFNTTHCSNVEASLLKPSINMSS